MNKEQLEQIIKEELEAAISEEELEEGFFSNLAAKLRGAKDGGWEAVAAQGDEEVPSSKQGGAADTQKIPVRPMIAKLLGVGLPTEIANELGKEIINQLKTVHGYTDSMIQEELEEVVFKQPNPRTTSNLPSRKKILDLSTVKIPKNMVKDIENLLSDMFSSYGFKGVQLGQGPEVEPQKVEPPTQQSKPPQEKPVDPALPISASEIAILQDLMTGGITRIITKSLADLKTAVTQEKDAEMLKALKRNILPKVNALYKRANIDLAEDLEHLEEERRGEKSARPLSKSQIGKLKGDKRAKMGLRSALVKIGNREPRLKRMMMKNFESSLKSIKNVTRVKGAMNKEFNRRMKAAQGNEKKMKEIRSIFDRQKKFLEKNPEQRQQQLEQNAQILIDAVMEIVDDGIKETLAQFSKEKQALPEQIDESFDRMQTLAGIKKKVL